MSHFIHPNPTYGTVTKPILRTASPSEGVAHGRPRFHRASAVVFLRCAGALCGAANASATARGRTGGRTGEGRPRQGRRRARGGAVLPAVPHLRALPRLGGGFATRPGH